MFRRFITKDERDIVKYAFYGLISAGTGIVAAKGIMRTLYGYEVTYIKSEPAKIFVLGCIAISPLLGGITTGVGAYAFLTRCPHKGKIILAPIIAYELYTHIKLNT